MNLHEGFRRRIRIESDPNNLIGRRVIITDVETGEEIANVLKAVITLDAREYNGVELTYAETDSEGKIIIRDDDIVRKTLRLNFPEVAVTAEENW